jgi:hypothetical protein
MPQLGELSDPKGKVIKPLTKGQMTDEEMKALMRNRKRKKALIALVLERSKALGAEPLSNSKFKPQISYCSYFRVLTVAWRRGFPEKIWNKLFAMKTIRWQEGDETVWVRICHATG